MIPPAMSFSSMRGPRRPIPVTAFGGTGGGVGKGDGGRELRERVRNGYIRIHQVQEERAREW